MNQQQALEYAGAGAVLGGMITTMMIVSLVIWVLLIIAYWKMDDGAGTVLKDASPNGNDLTLDSATQWPKVSLPE